MSSLLLDADVMIDLVRGIPNALAWLASLQEPPFVSCFAALEVLAGSSSKQERIKVERFLFGFLFVYPTEADINHALWNYSLFSLSHGVGAIDTLTASLAVSRGLTLVSRNVKHFAPLPNLKFLVPYI